MAKTITVYPNGKGRNGEKHLDKRETALELYHISFQVGDNKYNIFPEKLMVTVGGDRQGVRLDLLIADLLQKVDRLHQRVENHANILRGK